VVMPVDAVNAFDVVARLGAGSSTYDIPVVALTPSLHSVEASRIRFRGHVANGWIRCPECTTKVGVPGGSSTTN
jgi:hypothetical protein